MIFTISINQKAIVDAGFSGVKLHEWAIFDFIRQSISSTWAETFKEDGNIYVWISEQMILDQIPLLDLSKKSVHRLVNNLVDVGLLIRYHKNLNKKKTFIGMGPRSGEVSGTHSEAGGSNHQPTQNRSGHPPKIDQVTHPNLGGDNNTNENRINDNIPPTPLDGVSGETPVGGDELLEKKKRTASKKRITDKEAEEFYLNQLKDFPPTPKDLAPGPAVARKDMYRLLVRWMFKGGVGMRDGFRGTVLNMGSQLEYEEYCKLLDEQSLNDHQVREYLVRMHNYEKRHDNKSVYLTMLNWHREDVKHGRVPPSKPGMNGTSGQPVPMVARAIKHGPHGD